MSDMTHPVFPHVLSPEVIASFARDGFVKTEDVLTDDELSDYSSAVDLEIAARTAADTRSVADKTTYEQSFIQCMRLWETSHGVRPLTCHPGLAGIAAQLLGVDSIRLWQDQALYKEAGGRVTTPHQDETFWPIGNAPLVSAWIPFDAVTTHNGAMAYVPGSHLAGGLTPVDITHRSEPYDILRDPSLNRREPVWIAVDPGAVVWHHGFTVHQAAANHSDSTRRVFTIVYIAGNATRTKGWPCFPLDREDLAVGERLRGDGMPVLWPPPASLPETPSLIGESTGPQMRSGS
jgi:ectoine hydroxylase-related dioxygenase (phytanoyl-CoA dioxygenase family)